MAPTNAMEAGRCIRRDASRNGQPRRRDRCSRVEATNSQQAGADSSANARSPGGRSRRDISILDPLNKVLDASWVTAKDTVGGAND
jgi:hypothetical protein